MIVPNSRITNGNIVNHTTRATHRVDLKLCVGDECEVEHAPR